MSKRSQMQSLCFVLIPLTVVLLSNLPALARGDGSPQQPAEQIYNEMQTVYLGNLVRRDHGVPPLRWNAPTTEAACWFCWDSVENRLGDYCGHLDTLGRWPGADSRDIDCC